MKKERVFVRIFSAFLAVMFLVMSVPGMSMSARAADNDSGELVIDMTDGYAMVVGDSAIGFSATKWYLGLEGQIKYKYTNNGDNIDLDVDGNPDIRVKEGELCYFTVLQGKNISGRYSLQVKNPRKNQDEYYSKVTFILPESDILQCDRGVKIVDLSKGRQNYYKDEMLILLDTIFDGMDYLDEVVTESDKNQIDFYRYSGKFDFDKTAPPEISVTYDIYDLSSSIIPLETRSFNGTYKYVMSEKAKKFLVEGAVVFYNTVYFVFTAEDMDQVEKETQTGKYALRQIGETIIYEGAYYEITSVAESNRTVKYLRPESKNIKNGIVPDEIPIGAYKYKVTEIAEKAFKNHKQMTKATIGKNVKKIGTNAYNGCKKLKKLTVKTTLLKKKNVGKNAFKGLHSKAKAKVKKNVVKSYTKIFSAKGFNGKNQKVTK
ncbi:leucine-rich repeat protein [Butyrivibrio sp. AE3006]|uniref:leucine-rich repeat protein n=1 Tax=Butyrivibrio sp. AE3006 TaxID=1280673 RepID=UPI000405EC5F|nr:leucine-rich repeat protein [Butyrivibrio sp. AE3006]